MRQYVIESKKNCFDSFVQTIADLGTNCTFVIAVTGTFAFGGIGEGERAIRIGDRTSRVRYPQWHD